MKKLLLTLCAAVALVFTGCRYDDSDLWNSVNDLEVRVTTLEDMCKQMNTNISSLQTIVNALQDNDYITAVSPLYEGDSHVGYTIDFAKSESITIYHGKDGADGKDGINGADGKDGLNGSNGANGANGTDGYTPSIGILKDADGHYYWTLDGDWLLDNNGQRVLAEGNPGKDGSNGTNGKDGVDGKDGQNGADGKDGEDGTNGSNGTNGKDGKDGRDGTTPQFKIEEGDWYISLDNGLSWQYLGRGTGADGKDGKDGKDGQNGADGKDGTDGMDGDSMFSSIDTSNQDYVVFTLSNGTKIQLPTWYAFEELKKLCNQLNVNIQSLQTIVEAVQDNDFLLSVTPKMEDGKPVGYTLTFSKSGVVEIYHGKDGSDGKDGEKGETGDKGDKGDQGDKGDKGDTGASGKDGDNGKDAVAPVIGVKEYEGILYWTVNGEFLTDDRGQKIPVTGKEGKDGQNGANGENGQNGSNGKDGITPQFKIQDGYWWISYDNGNQWQNLGQATGDKGDKGDKGDTGADGKNGQNGSNGKDGVDGKNGDSFFQSVDNNDPDYLILTLSDGSEVRVPKDSNLGITFDNEYLGVMRVNSTRNINYEITGNTKDLQVEVLSSGNVKAKINNTTSPTGILTVTTGSTIDEYDKVVMLVSNGKRTLMKSISFEESGLRVTSDLTYELSYEEQDIAINVSSNINFIVKVPDSAVDWISNRNSRGWTESILNIHIGENKGDKREAFLSLVDEDSYVYQTIKITQSPSPYNIPEDMSLAFPDPIFRQYVLGNFDTNGDNKITMSEAELVTSISVNKTKSTSSTQKIKTLQGIQYFINLLTLKCEYNELTDIDLSCNKLLRNLQCGNNKLTSLDVSNNSYLSLLTCESNNLTDLDIKNNINIKTLWFGFNSLNEIDLSHNIHLHSFDCRNNKISKLDFSSNNEITQIICEYNGITSLDVSNHPTLTRLNCSSYNGELRQLNISGCNALEYISIQYNGLKELDVTHTNLNNSEDYYPLNCYSNILKTLYIKRGWRIYGITHIDSGQITACINNSVTSIEYKD